MIVLALVLLNVLAIAIELLVVADRSSSPASSGAWSSAVRGRFREGARQTIYVPGVVGWRASRAAIAQLAADLASGAEARRGTGDDWMIEVVVWP